MKVNQTAKEATDSKIVDGVIELLSKENLIGDPTGQNPRWYVNNVEFSDEYWIINDMLGVFSNPDNPPTTINFQNHLYDLIRTIDEQRILLQIYLQIMTGWTGGNGWMESAVKTLEDIINNEGKICTVRQAEKLLAILKGEDA